MLHKCANPVCNVPFRSMREGKLFLAETFPQDMDDSHSSARRKLRRREHFWLCDVCASQFTLRIDTTLHLTAVPLEKRPDPAGLARFATLN